MLRGQQVEILERRHPGWWDSYYAESIDQISALFCKAVGEWLDRKRSANKPRDRFISNEDIRVFKERRWP